MNKLLIGAMVRSAYFDLSACRIIVVSVILHQNESDFVCVAERSRLCNV